MLSNNVYLRIKCILAEKKLSNSDMARILGISRQLFTDWQKNHKAGIWHVLDKILYEFPDVRREWLYAGTEPMLHNDVQRMLTSNLFLLFDAIYPLQINTLIKQLLSAEILPCSLPQVISSQVTHSVYILNMSIVILSKIIEKIQSDNKELRILGGHVTNFESQLNLLHYSFCQMIKLPSHNKIEVFHKSLADVAVHFDFPLLRNLFEVQSREQGE